ncbi:MAG: glycoside hydrolase family 15 protein [Proteobacteria bacterium]|nr:glycoside hydrolase family 15 protein [Pseudomonadota bacterium]
MTPSASLDLALIGNGRLAMLVDAQGAIVWGCFPELDGDPVFSALVAGDAAAAGRYAVELADLAHVEQAYERNSAVLTTRLTDRHGGIVDIVDCLPRFAQNNRLFQPMLHVRQVKRVAGTPRITLVLAPTFEYGRVAAAPARGSNHLRYTLGTQTLRLTTDAPLAAIAEGNAFLLHDDVTLLFGADETVAESPREVGRRFVEETLLWWRAWVRRLAIPFEWQEDVIRAAITLKLNACDDTGAIVAAVTTSIPEAPDSGRNWDYRYCWLRDAYFVIEALNRLNATDTMEAYLRYVVNIAANGGDAPLQPMYRISGDPSLPEMTVPGLAGYRGMGPVRIGNDAWRQMQNDVYGSAVLAGTHVFFDARLTNLGDASLFARLEPLGERAFALHAEPDAGIWEYRGRARVHTFSAVMCWAACDRLARIARRLRLPDRAEAWQARADTVARFIDAQCFSPERNAFVGAVGSTELDASLLRLIDVGYVKPDDPRYVGTVEAIGRELKRGDFVFRYLEKDDFGVPTNAFVVCTFWYVNALAAIGRKDEARALFERLLAARNRHGLLAEHLDPATGEPWGNFVQTYSMVGIIEAAMRLSAPWEDAF